MSTKAKTRRKYSESETVGWWLEHGLFANECEAVGAFKLAYNQWMDGLDSAFTKRMPLHVWLGVSEADADSWWRYLHASPENRGPGPWLSLGPFRGWPRVVDESLTSKSA